LTNSIQVVAEFFFSVLSGIVFSHFCIRGFFGLKEPVKVILDLPDGTGRKDVWYPYVGMGNMATHLGHLDEGESNAVVLHRPEK